MACRPGAALAAGALDGFIGFIVQALILASLLLFTSASLEVDVGSAAGGAGRLLVWMVIAAAAAARRRGGRAAPAPLASSTGPGGSAPKRSQAVRGLQSPRRLGLLFGGSLATEVLFAAALGTFVYAFGFRVGHR